MPDQIDSQIDQILGGQGAGAPLGGTPTADPYDAQINQILGTPAGGSAQNQQTSSSAPANSSSSVLPAPLRWPLGIASAGARGLAYGLGVPGDLEQLGVQYITNPLSRLTGIGSPEPVDQGHLFFPTSSTMLDVASHAGLIGYPGLAPQSSAESFAQSAASGLGSALPLIAAGQPPIPTGIMGATGAVSGEAARQMGAPVPLQIGAGLIGGLAGGGAAQAGIRALSRDLPAVANSLGTSSTLMSAGDELQSAARDWKTNIMPAKEAAVWNPVDAAIPPTSNVSLTNFGSALQSINKSAGQLQPLANLLTSNLPRQLASALGKTTASIVGADWSDARTIRSMLGDAMGNPKLVQDIGEQNLKHLYAGITADLQDTAQGQGAGDLFNAANAESTRLHAIAEGPMSRIVSGTRPSVADDPKAENVAQQLLTGGKRGATDLQVLRQEIPSAVDELAAAHLKMNPDAKAWSKMAPEAQEALVPNPADRDILNRTASGSIAAQKSPLAKIGEHTLGLWLGGAAGAAISPLLPIAMNPYVAGGIGEIAGAAAPFIYHGIRSAVKNPLAAVPGPVGAAANPNLP